MVAIIVATMHILPLISVSHLSFIAIQQLTGRMAALSKFISAGGDNGHPYFQCLRRNNRFVWTPEYEEAFIKLKEYLTSP